MTLQKITLQNLTFIIQGAVGPPPLNTIRVSGIGFPALKSDICKKK